MFHLLYNKLSSVIKKWLHNLIWSPPGWGISEKHFNSKLDFIQPISGMQNTYTAEISDAWNICQVSIFLPHFCCFLYAGGRPAIMPLCYLVTKQLSGFCSYIPSDWACYKIPQHPVWIKKQQPVEIKLLVMIFLDWLDGGEDLRCLEEDETIPHSRGPVGKTFLTFNYLYINKVRYKISYCSFRNANNICIFARKVLQTTFQALFSFMMMNLTTLLSVKLPRIK